MKKLTQSQKSKVLYDLLSSGKLEFAMEAHSGLSAVIAEEVGFKCLWASGLSVSAMTGCRDRNELDITEVCKIVEWMADHTNIPILVDGDTGGVDFNAARIMVNKLVKAGAAGVCIEDKLYPKHNSFLDNSNSDLADPLVHAGKIRAMKKENPNFVVIARLEEYISGAGFEEAYSRALIYQDAGADAILVHSKKKTSADIDEFMNKWTQDRLDGLYRAPVVIVPTKYYTTPTDHFSDIGVSLVIWANHNLRASIKAMQDTSKDIFSRQSLTGVEKNIATVNEIFRLQRDDELVLEEKKFLPAYGGTAVILSAVTSRFNPETPKALEVIEGSTVLERQVEAYKNVGVLNLRLVAGRLEEKFSSTELSKLSMFVGKVVNEDWSTTTEVGSALKGLGSLENPPLPLFISYGDLIFKSQVLSRMTQAQDADIVIGVDPDYDPNRYNEFISGDMRYRRSNTSDEFNLINGGASDSIPDNDFVGSFIGVVCVNNFKGLCVLREALEKVSENPKARFVEVLKYLHIHCKVKGVYVTGQEWIDINSHEDIEKAGGVS